MMVRPPLGLSVLPQSRCRLVDPLAFAKPLRTDVLSICREAGESKLCRFIVLGCLKIIDDA
jgi:hypothetical protein